jgi:hypothetical protein
MPNVLFARTQYLEALTTKPTCTPRSMTLRLFRGSAMMSSAAAIADEGSGATTTCPYELTVECGRGVATIPIQIFLDV